MPLGNPAIPTDKECRKDAEETEKEEEEEEQGKKDKAKMPAAYGNALPAERLQDISARTRESPGLLDSLRPKPMTRSRKSTARMLVFWARITSRHRQWLSQWQWKHR